MNVCSPFFAPRLGLCLALASWLPSFGNTYNAAYSGPASGLIYGGTTLNLATGASGISITVTSGVLTGTGQIFIGGTNNTVTFDGPGTTLASTNSQNYPSGSFQVKGSGTKFIVSNGAQVSSYGYCTMKESNNEIRVTGAGSWLGMSVDPGGNDGFESTNQSNKLTITNGGMVTASGSGFIAFAATPASGNYACTIDGEGSTLNVSAFSFYSNVAIANLGGILHAMNGGALELQTPNLRMINFESGSVPAQQQAMANHILIDGGVISYRNCTGVKMAESITASTISSGIDPTVYNLQWAGENALRLNGSISSDAGTYTLANNLGPKNYTRLEMVDGTTSVARSITIDGNAGGSILFRNATASIPAGITLVGPATLTARGAPSTLAGVISGTDFDSLTKTGPGALTLTGDNIYSGDTTVKEGILGLTHANLADTSTITIGTQLGANAVLKLDHGQVDTVNKLFIDGQQKPAGFYGSSSSPAAIQDDDSFQGTGVLHVLTGSSGGTYYAWIAGFNLPQNPPGQDEPEFDFDSDGFKNALEYVMGGNPSNPGDTGGPSSTGGLLEVTPDGENFVVTFPRAIVSRSTNTTVSIEIGGDMINWPESYSVGVDTATSHPFINVSPSVTIGFETVTLTRPIQPVDRFKCARLRILVAPRN